MKKIDWKKIKTNIRIGIVGFTIVYIFGLYKKSAVNGLPVFSKENLIEMAIGTAIMLVLVIVLTYITNIYDKISNKRRDITKSKKKESL